MTPTDDPWATAALRAQAEAALHAKEIAATRDQAALTPDATRAMLHELQVHQIELELQNEELRRAELRLEESQARYSDLYESAPLGFCTVSGEGILLEANLAFASELGVARSALVSKPLARFIHQEDRDIFYLFCRQFRAAGERQVCELRILRPDGVPFWALLTATAHQHGRQPANAAPGVEQHHYQTYR
jgi:PAS domain S-box-containing protein